MLIRPVQIEDVAPLIEMLKASGMFDEDGLNHVQATLDNYFSGNSEEMWFSAEHDGLMGITYCAPEVMADSVWNLLMLWVNPDYQRQGVGTALIARIENELKNRAARLLLVETSSLDDYTAARALYRSQGFTAEAVIRNYYTDKEDKLIFTKAISS